MEWILRDAFRDIVLTDRARATGAGEGREALRAFAWLGGLAAMNARDRLRLEALLFRGTRARSTDALRDAIEAAIASGRMAASVRPRRRVVMPAPPPEEQPAYLETPTSWIEIELLDAAGAPVPDEHYRVELADGRIRAGTLNARGRAREDEIDPGTCKVIFPRIDGAAWTPAATPR